VVEVHFQGELGDSGCTIGPYDCYHVFPRLLALRLLRFSSHSLLAYPKLTDLMIHFSIGRCLVVDQEAVEQNRLPKQGQDYPEDSFYHRSASDLIGTGAKVPVAARDDLMASTGGKVWQQMHRDCRSVADVSRRLMACVWLLALALMLEVVE
jgi:hypothetical protein